MATSGVGDTRVSDALEHSQAAEQRLAELESQLEQLDAPLDDAKITAALTDFDTVWAHLAPREQCRIVELLVERVVYDGAGGNISITFRPSGIKALAGETTGQEEEAA